MIKILNVEAIMIHSGGHWNNWNPKEKWGKANKTPSAVSNALSFSMCFYTYCNFWELITIGKEFSKLILYLLPGANYQRTDNMHSYEKWDFAVCWCVWGGGGLELPNSSAIPLSSLHCDFQLIFSSHPASTKHSIFIELIFSPLGFSADTGISLCFLLMPAFYEGVPF